MEDVKTAIFYGSDSGSTKKVAELLSQKLNVPAEDISDIDVEDFEQYDLLILGTPTVNSGEIQSDWDYVLDEIEDLDLSSVKVAVFGLGDQVEYGSTFVDAMIDITEACEEAGAEIIGQWPSDGYKHSESRSEKDGLFVGLALDMERQAALTEQRVTNWIEMLR